MEKLYTGIARCAVCKLELNRAEHVPEEKKSQVIIGAPLMALCPVKEHNTMEGLNLKVQLEWVEETA